jgi:hypothetical protein
MTGKLVFAALVLVALPLAGCVQIPEPGLRVDEGLARRSLVCEVGAIGEIQRIARLEPAPQDGVETWVGGEDGCVLLGSDGSPAEPVLFEQRLLNPAPIDVDGDGHWETMDCGEGWSSVKLLDDAGRLLWVYPRENRSAWGPSPDAMAAGPLGEDGELLFVIGLNAGDGVRVLDVDGQIVKRLRGTNVFSVAVADLDGDGSAEMLTTQAAGPGGQIRVRDVHGCRLRTLHVDSGGFSLIRWPRPDSPPRLLIVEGGNTVQIFDPCAGEHGRVIAEYELPDYGFSEGEGALFTPAPGSDPWLAVTRTIRATWQRSALYVFDAERRLVYHEVFPFSDVGMAVVPAAPGDARSARTEDLLVGEGSRVWRYELKARVTDQPLAASK